MTLPLVTLLLLVAVFAAGFGCGRLDRRDHPTDRRSRP